MLMKRFANKRDFIMRTTSKIHRSLDVCVSMRTYGICNQNSMKLPGCRKMLFVLPVRCFHLDTTGQLFRKMNNNLMKIRPNQTQFTFDFFFHISRFSRPFWLFYCSYLGITMWIQNVILTPFFPDNCVCRSLLLIVRIVFYLRHLYHSHFCCLHWFCLHSAVWTRPTAVYV